VAGPARRLPLLCHCQSLGACRILCALFVGALDHVERVVCRASITSNVDCESSLSVSTVEGSRDREETSVSYLLLPYRDSELVFLSLLSTLARVD